MPCQAKCMHRFFDPAPHFPVSHKYQTGLRTLLHQFSQNFQHKQMVLHRKQIADMSNHQTMFQSFPPARLAAHVCIPGKLLQADGIGNDFIMPVTIQPGACFIRTGKPAGTQCIEHGLKYPVHSHIGRAGGMGMGDPHFCPAQFCSQQVQRHCGNIRMTEHNPIPAPFHHISDFPKVLHRADCFSRHIKQPPAQRPDFLIKTHLPVFMHNKIKLYSVPVNVSVNIHNKVSDTAGRHGTYDMKHPCHTLFLR